MLPTINSIPRYVSGYNKITKDAIKIKPNGNVNGAKKSKEYRGMKIRSSRSNANK